MSKLVFDGAGEKFYETGVSKGVLFPQDTTGNYTEGVAWNGLTAVNENPSGAEETKLYADDIKYASLRSAEDFGATIEAYTYPDEFMECDGSAEIAKGVYAGQQARKAFGFTYQTVVGNDNTTNAGRKIHIVYNATASPSGKSYSTINESPDAITFSWEVSTAPIPMPAALGLKPSATIVIDTTKIPREKRSFIGWIEGALYGTDDNDSYLPLPEEILTEYNKATTAA